MHCSLYLRMYHEAFVWRSSWQPDFGRAACVSRLCDTSSQCFAWCGTSLTQWCQICGTSGLLGHREVKCHHVRCEWGDMAGLVMHRCFIHSNNTLLSIHRIGTPPKKQYFSSFPFRQTAVCTSVIAVAGLLVSTLSTAVRHAWQNNQSAINAQVCEN